MKKATRIIHERWKNYKDWQKKNTKLLREETTIRSLGEFKEAYSYYNNLSTMKRKAVFGMDTKTRDTILKRYVESEKARKKKLLDEGFDVSGETFHTNFKKLKENPEFYGMTTREWAKIMSKEINDFKLELTQKTTNKKEIRLAISQHFFGS